MFKFKRKNKKGFTLTEMLVVVLVISVLAVVAIPSYNRAVERTRAAQGITTLQNIAKAQANYVAKRGSYTPNMYSLPIDLKDKDGKDIEGSTFDDQYFGYTVYGDILSQSIAKREDGWNYELAIDYDTGKLYCSPADNAICGMLGFEENTKRLPTSGDSTSKFVCKDNNCFLYDGDKIIGKCYREGINKEGTGCLYDDRNGFVCDGDFCAQYDNGVFLEGTECDKKWLNKEGTACAKQTFECYEDKGICTTYKDGEEFETCKMSKYGAWCASTILRCDEKGVCWTDTEGETSDVCDVLKDEECAKKYNFDGVVCNDAGSCSVFKSGENLYTCDKNSNICKLNETGKECPANSAFDGCAKNELICRNDVCAYYDENGDEKYKCGYDNPDCMKENGVSGTYCDSKGVCRTYEKGEYTWECDKEKGTCKNAKDGTECPANPNLNGCKEEGKWVCKGSKCDLIDAFGNSLKTCELGNDSCFKDNNIDATLCDDSSCITYKPGENPLKCVKDTGMCYDGSGFECKSNATFSGCAEEGSSGIINCKLADWKCMEENKYSGTLCDEDGSHCRVYKDGVLKEEFNCDSSACVTYDADGNQTMKCLKEEGVCNYSGGQCKANATFTGCADDSGVVYSGTWQCGGNTCKLVDEKGNVIQVCNMSQGSSCFENNKVDGVVCVEDGTCYTYENGKNVLKCQNGKCYDEKGKECVANYYGTACRPEGNTSNRPCEVSCKNGTCSCWDENGALYFDCPYGNNECFKNVGFSGTYCDEDGNCSTYENGEQLYQCANNGICVNKITGKECTSNETFSGCKDEGTSANGLKCEDFTCTDDWGKTCYDNGKGECIKGDGLELACYKDKGECHWYENGKETGSCAINETGDGCKEESTSSGDLECSGDTCHDADGNECFGNGNGGCIEGKGTEFACYKDKGRCITYKDGKRMEECDINEAGDGCKEESTSGHKDGTFCTKNKCETYKDGELVSYCKYSSNGSVDCHYAGGSQCTPNDTNTGCAEESTSSGAGYTCDGWTCVDDNGLYVCDSNGKDGCIEGKGEEVVCMDGQCMTYKDGKKTDWCTANDEGTGCKEESTSSGSLDDYKYTVCDSNGECKATNNSDVIVNNGIVCDKESKTCDVYKDGKKTDWCEANDEGTGCKATAAPEAAPEAEPAQPANGLVCEDWECKEYKDGEAVSSCYSNGDGGCIEGKGTEFVCIDGKCYHYENGEYKNSCNANATGDGCSKDGFSCDGETCTGVKYGQKTTCYNNGNGGCIEGKGQEFACVNGKCYTYKDGKLESSCEANAAGTGCKQESSSTLDPETSGILCYGGKCKQFENGEIVSFCYYDEAAGETSCKPNKTNSGDSLSAGNSGLLCNVDAGKCYTYKDGKLESSCNINSAGNGCAPVSSSLVCKDGSCTYYKEDGHISYTCKTGDYECFLKNGGAYVETTCDGGYCMTHEQGKPNYYCSKDGDGTCYYYDNNMKIQTCTANATYSGCK